MGSNDQVGALMFAAKRMGGRITVAQASAIIDVARASPRYRSADSVARQLGVTYLVCERLDLRTIGSIDVKKRARKEMRKRKDRLYQERKHRARGAKPQSESLSAKQPWLAAGICRASWYRQAKRDRETVSSAIALSIAADEVVSSKTEVGPPDGGVCLRRGV
jgi:hypothetical protein